MNEKISILMGIYNCESTLGQAIESILQQTYCDWELILCDDASTDGTYALAQTYQAKYPEKIILIRNEVNSRLAFTLNHCLSRATGHYIARMDADDTCTNDRFEKQVAYLKAHPEIDLVSTAMQRFDQNGLGSIVYGPDNPDKFSLRHGVPFQHATILTYKRVFDSLGGYRVSKETRRSQDYELWFRFFHKGFKGVNLKEPLYWVREDRNAISRRSFRNRMDMLTIAHRGYRLLNYPKWWFWEFAIVTLSKALCPDFLVGWYRKWQKKHNAV